MKSFGRPGYEELAAGVMAIDLAPTAVDAARDFLKEFKSPASSKIEVICFRYQGVVLGVRELQVLFLKAKMRTGSAVASRQEACCILSCWLAASTAASMSVWI